MKEPVCDLRVAGIAGLLPLGTTQLPDKRSVTSWQHRAAGAAEVDCRRQPARAKVGRSRRSQFPAPPAIQVVNRFLNRLNSYSAFPLFVAAMLAMEFLSGCTTSPTVSSKITSTVSAHGVRSLTATKIQNGRALNYQDIRNLVVTKVPTSTMIAYLQSTEKPYQFSAGQLGSLKKLGASQQLINYLNESEGFYASYPQPSPSPSFWNRLWKKNFLTAPGLQRSIYNTDSLSEWEVIDPAYDESLYSPFSF